MISRWTTLCFVLMTGWVPGEAKLPGPVTTKPSKATAPVQDKRVPVNAKQRRMPGEQDQRPKFAPSNAVHVTESAGHEHRNGSSSDFWSLRGYTLKEAFEEMYGVTGARLRMPEALEAGGHFDFEIVLPVAESRGKMRERMEAGVLEHFHLAAARVKETREVYVLTAVAGRRPPAMGGRRAGDFEFESIVAPEETDEWKPVSLEDVRGVAATGTMDDFGHQFEANLDRPVVNETRLTGQFRVTIKAGDVDRNDFSERLRSEMGLVLTAAERDVEMLVVRPAP